MNKQIMKLVWLLIVLFSPFAGQSKTWYVSPAGSDSNGGNITAPFKNVSRALGVMNSGDSCVLRGGTYREQIVVNKANITLCNYPSEKVLITGCNVVEQLPEVYVNPKNGQTFYRVKSDEKVYQLFVNGRRMDIARWPNKTAPMLSMKDWEPSTVDAKNAAKEVIIPSIPNQTTDYWKGGYYIGVNCETAKLATWFTGGGEISSSMGNLLFLTNTCFGVGTTKNANGNGFGYILNCLNALDTENEWYWGDGYIYLKYPAGTLQQEALVEARTKVYILNVNADYARIEGIDFRAGAVLVEGNHTAIENCTFSYTSPFVWNAGNDSEESGARCNWGDYTNGSSGLCVLGNNFTMKDSYVAHSWFNGIVLWGNSCMIDNCIIEDVNWMGKRCSGINSYGEDNTVRYCTIRNTGASSIEGGNGAWIKKYAIRNLWEHNRCENACKLVVDQGFFYVNHQSGAFPMANSEWRYNILMNNRGPEKGEWTTTNVGLYVDNSSSGYKVHHNVVVDTKEGIRYNDVQDGTKAGKNVYFYNNTFYKVDQCMAAWVPAGTAVDADVTICNNLGIECGGYVGVVGKKISNVEFANKSSVENADNLIFTLKEEKYIDAGTLVTGIDIEYKGSAPDIGARESGLSVWKAGSNLVIKDGFIDRVTAVNQVDNGRKLNISVYPNPVLSILNIDFAPIGWEMKKNLKVMNLNGQILFTKNIYGEDYRIDTSGLSAGIYFLMVEKEGLLETCKFTKL